MSESDRPKPLPARPAPPPSSGEASAETAPAEAPPGQAPPSSPSEPPEEVEIPWQGRTWIARVVGRSGRARARSAPLLLVGFWDAREAGAEAHMLESMVPGRRLTDVPEDVLVGALARAKAPPVPGQRRPFFDDAESPRRPGSGGEY